MGGEECWRFDVYVSSNLQFCPLGTSGIENCKVIIPTLPHSWEGGWLQMAFHEGLLIFGLESSVFSLFIEILRGS